MNSWATKVNLADWAGSPVHTGNGRLLLPRTQKFTPRAGRLVQPERSVWTSTFAFQVPAKSRPLVLPVFRSVTDKTKTLSAFGVLQRLSFPARAFSTTPLVTAKPKTMPPKKTTEQPPLLLGRPGNNLKAGIVGLANVGKSTFFQSITKSFLGNPANFPYATIDPEEAKCIVPDERFDWLCELYKPKSKIPAHLTIFDIAGLTKGASTGAGLGNAFLSHIRAVDALFQVVRCFDDAEIIHVEGDVDPCRDLQIINDELLFKDTEWVEKYLEAAKKNAKTNGPALDKKKREEEVATTEKVLAVLKSGKSVRKQQWNPKEVESINTMQLLSAKPVIYLVNLSEKDYIRQKNKHLPKIKQWVDEHAKGDQIIPFSVCFEERLTQMQDEAAALEECKTLNTRSMMSKIITTGYTALNLIYYFTAGPDEVRAWTIQRGTKAPAAAGVIHTDFEKTFILGEITPYADLKENGSEAAAKAAGKTRSQGKEYVMNDGDLVFWKCGKKG